MTDKTGIKCLKSKLHAQLKDFILEKLSDFRSDVLTELDKINEELEKAGGGIENADVHGKFYE